MNLKVNLTKSLSGSTGILMAMGALPIFLGGLYYIFFMSQQAAAPLPTGVDTVDIAASNNYQQYAEYVEDARMAGRTLVELEQFKKLSVYEFGGSSVSYDPTPNPFGKFF